MSGINMLYSVYYRNTPAWYISHDFIINYYYSVGEKEKTIKHENGRQIESGVNLSREGARER